MYLEIKFDLCITTEAQIANTNQTTFKKHSSIQTYSTQNKTSSDED